MTYELWIRVRSMFVGKMNAQPIFAGERFTAFFALKFLFALNLN